MFGYQLMSCGSMHERKSRIADMAVEESTVVHNAALLRGCDVATDTNTAKAVMDAYLSRRLGLSPVDVR
jgi:hypothetical protein